MVNFNDMQVGSVTDVAQNMNQMNPNMPHTQSVSDVQLNNQAINSIGNSVVEPTTIPIQPHNEPLMQNNNVRQPNMSVQNFGVAPVESSPINTPVEPAPVESSPINTPVEPLEMFGIEEVPSQPKGSAVAGFSSVNIEK